MVDEARVRALQKKSNLIGVATLLVFLILIGVSFRELSQIRTEIEGLRSEVSTLTNDKKDLEKEVKRYQDSIEELKKAQDDILDFLGNVTKGESISFLDISPEEWERTKRNLLELPPGPRKKAALGAILLAWKEIPFSLGGKKLTTGMDSTSFVKLVLRNGGVQIPDDPRRRPSEVMMEMFKKVETPESGDLMFYRGNVGSFSMIYLTQGQASGHGICLGTFETRQPVQIMDSAGFNTAVYPFLGYYKVNYSN